MALNGGADRNRECPLLRVTRKCQGRGPKSVFDPHSEIRPTGQQLCLTSSTPFRDASLSWYGRIRGSNETARVRGCSPQPAYEPTFISLRRTSGGWTIVL